MLGLITGLSGSGKTEKVRALAAQYLESGETGITVIVPEQYSFAAERSFLERFGAYRADKIKVLSFSRLAQKVIEKAGIHIKDNIDDAARVILMGTTLDDLNDKLTVYSSHASSRMVTSELIGLSSELKQCAVSPEDLRAAAERIPESLLKEKTKEIALILETYDTELALSYSDDRDDTARAYDILGELDYFCGGVVMIDGFKGFTKSEMKLIERMLVQAREVYVTLCTDKLFPVEDENAVFTCVRKTARDLMRCAEKHSVKVAAPIELSAGESAVYRSTQIMEHLERGFRTVAANSFDGRAEGIEIYEAENIYDECEYVARSVKKLLRSGYRCRDIAVIFRNEGSYENRLNAALKKYGVPVFDDRRHPITAQPLCVMLDAVLKIVFEGFKSEYVLRFLKTGLSPLSEDEVDELENYAFLVSAEYSVWLSDWTMHPKGYGYEFTPETYEYLEKINALRRRAVEPLVRLKKKLSDDFTDPAREIYLFLDEMETREKLKEYSDFLEENGEPSLAEEQERVWDSVMGVLDSLHTVIGNRKLSHKRFYELYSLAMGVQTLGSIPQSIDSVTVGSAERIRTGSPRAVFIVGANEGVFPKSPVTTGILTDSEREKLRGCGLELPELGEDKTLRERFLEYINVCCAKEKLFVSYRLFDGSSESLAPSEIVSRLKKIFPSVKTMSAACTEPTEMIEGELPAFELLCSNYSGSVLGESLKEYFYNREDFSDKISSLERAVSGRDFQIENGETAKMLFGSNLYLSASRIESYYRCPFKYFCEYGLKIKKAAPVSFDPLQRGTVIHYVLENFLKNHPGDALMKVGSDEIKREVDALLREYMEERLSGAERSERFVYLYIRLGKTLCELIEALAEEFTVSSFRPVDFELAIDNDGDIKPYSVDLPDGKKLKVKGKIDRVDSFEADGKKYIRIIDYKSGGKKFDLGEVLDGLNLQMLIYLFTVWKNGGARYGDIIPAGILYKPAKTVISKAQRDSDKEKIINEKKKTLRMDGMILNDSVAVLAMDNTVSGLYVPVGTSKKDNALKGNLISLKQLADLEKKADDILRDMAKGLHSGRIAALPFKKDKITGCDYCDYSQVCSHEEDSPYRELGSLNFSEALEIIEKGDKQ